MKNKNNTIRISYVGIICIVFFFAIICIRLVLVSCFDNVDEINIKEFAKNRNTVTKKLSASRGTIYSINGEALAQDVNSYTVIAYLSDSRTTDKENPKHVVDKEYTANTLAPYLNMTPEYILKLLNYDTYQVELGPGGRNISENLKQQIQSLDLPGIDFITSSKRYYPYGDFASYIIGYAKKNDAGKINGELGVEAYYNDELTGKEGKTTYQQDAYGYQIPDTPVITTKAKSGDDIYLTIDSNVQMYLENALNELSNKTKYEWATVTVADAKTGAILGSAAKPSYNPNKLNITNYNNPLVSYSYEPGSTMKIYTFMAAMEEGKYEGSKLYSSGSFMIGEDKVIDWNKYGWGEISYDTGFTYSSNTAAANLGLAVGKDKLIKYFENFGFGARTGIEMANEYSGEIDPIYKIEVANASFGQGITTTPIQNIEALTSIANNGTTLKPYIVSKIVDTNTNKVVYEAKTQKLEKVVSKQTVEKIKELMYLTVNSDDTKTTGQMYRPNQTVLIGKTGTAQIAKETGGYYSDDTNVIHSFAGLFPYEDPKFIIYISVQRLYGPTEYMAESIKSIVDSISKYKNLSDLVVDTDETQVISVANYINKTSADSLTNLQALGLNAIIIGDGERVINQYPSKGTNLTKGSKIFLLTNTLEYTIPNMKNWTSSDAKNYCNLVGLKCNIEGYGLVKSQSIKAGNKINKDSKLNIVLAKDDDNEKESEESKESKE